MSSLQVISPIVEFVSAPVIDVVGQPSIVVVSEIVTLIVTGGFQTNRYPTGTRSIHGCAAGSEALDLVQISRPLTDQIDVAVVAVGEIRK